MVYFFIKFVLKHIQMKYTCSAPFLTERELSRIDDSIYESHKEKVKAFKLLAKEIK